MSEDARFRKGFLLALVAAIFSGLAHPLCWRLRTMFHGREAVASAVTPYREMCGAHQQPRHQRLASAQGRR